MSADQQELARDLGFLEAYTIGLGTMIGAGIFVLPSLAAEQAGPASMVAFFVGGLISLLAAISLSELATGMPKAGGSYYYVNRALGPFFGCVVGWGMWAGLTFASAFYMIGFGQYLLPGLGQYIAILSGWGDIGITVAALAMAAFLTGVNYYGVKETGALQNVIVLTLVGLIVTFLALGALDGPTTGEFNPFGWPAVAATVGTVYVTFIGFEVIATSAEEIKNPSRNLPLSMIAAVVTPTLMYVGVMWVSTGTLSIDALATSEIPVADVAAGFLGDIGSIAMIVGAVLATVSSANASILSAARVNFAMGRDRILHNWLNDVHDRFRTPYRSITATGIITLVLIAIGVGIGTLAEVASFMYLVTYSLVHVGVVVMRRAQPSDYDPDFHIPSVLYPIVPAVGMVACLAVLLQMSISVGAYALPMVGVTLPARPTVVGAIGSAVVVGGAVWYALYAREHAPSESLLGEAIAPTAESAGDDAGPYRVVVPVANPETERGLLELAAASAHAHEADAAELVAVNVIEVPDQTALAQDVAFEEERVQAQQELLRHARDIVETLDVGIRTRAIVARSVGDAILDVVDDESADQVMLGWRGSRNTREHILGSTIDPIARDAPCDVSLVKLREAGSSGDIGDVTVLAGRGPHAPVAARRAAEFVTSADDATLTLLNVQPTDAEDPAETGDSIVSEVAEAAGLAETNYTARVLVADDGRETLLSEAAAADTVCVGATRSTSVTQAVFGSLPETIGSEVPGTVVICRGRESSPRSIREAVVDRLTE